MELAAQVGAVVGTSALLYFITKPKHQDIGELSDPTILQGCMKYSPYHRRKLSYSLSMRTASTVSDDASASSSVTSDNSPQFD